MRILLLLLLLSQSVRGLIPPLRSRTVQSFPLPAKKQHVERKRMGVPISHVRPLCELKQLPISKLTSIRIAAVTPLFRRLRVTLATALLALSILVGGGHSDLVTVFMLGVVFG